MVSEHGPTMLSTLLRERGVTAEEFSEQANRYARQHGIDATLSPRHVHRLASGRRADGRPLGPVRLGTRRLLEEMLGIPVDRLLKPTTASPDEVRDWSSEALELRARIASGRNVDQHTIALLQEKLDLTRVIDRRLGGTLLLGELRAQVDQMWALLASILNHSTRISLARVLVDSCTLAGWQSLDQGDVHESWQHYDRARSAARVAESSALEAYACAGQAVVLMDIGNADSATELTAHACHIAHGSSPAILTAWLYAGHGEALAATGDEAGSQRAFDNAEKSLIEDNTDAPYLVFDSTHLARWRGSAMARLHSQDATEVLTAALERMDPSFTRAEAALRIDLAQTLTNQRKYDEAAAHIDRARLLAAQIGSTRQRRRLEAFTTR